ncbi:hypothetical protein MIMGU_mgv1a016519mg [Erythranthe guttata]|uniref:Uncharacterized protein n=1 Tax=Erythranthe guttata TaxID=4155 RepID=A0A022RPI4_ERYGU|nr:hypothetical protein MIMGU_mgv1a016519mg [Erythranthe guttata]
MRKWRCSNITATFVSQRKSTQPFVSDKRTRRKSLNTAALWNLSDKMIVRQIQERKKPKLHNLLRDFTAKTLLLDKSSIRMRRALQNDDGIFPEILLLAIEKNTAVGGGSGIGPRSMFE